jgi:hypothetical protein
VTDKARACITTIASERVVACFAVYGVVCRVR